LNDGATRRAFGLRGFPSVVIMDTEWKVAFHSAIEPENRELFMEDIAPVAKTNGIPWPPNEASGDTEINETMNRLMEAMYSRELDRLLLQ
jgi:hypothetical protein